MNREGDEIVTEEAKTAAPPRLKYRSPGGPPLTVGGGGYLYIFHDAIDYSKR